MDWAQVSFITMKKKKKKKKKTYFSLSFFKQEVCRGCSFVVLQSKRGLLLRSEFPLGLQPCVCPTLTLN